MPFLARPHNQTATTEGDAMCQYGRLLLAALILPGLLMTSPPAWGQIKIGGVTPLSPPGGVENGRVMQQAMELAIEELNAKGGLLGQKVELVMGDTAGLPEKGTAVMERLITKDKVVAVAGENHSSVALAEIEVAHRHGVPLVICEAWSDDITGRQYPEVFRITVANSLVYAIVADWIKEVGFKHVAVIAENSDWGLGTLKIFNEKLKALGITVTSFSAERTVTDFTPQLLKFKNMSPKPDLLINAFTGTGEFLMVKQAYDLGFAPTKDTAHFAGGTEATEPDFWKAVGKAGVHVIVNPAGLSGIPKTPVSERFTKVYRAKYGSDPSAVAMEGYDGIMVIAEAIRAANSTDPKKIAAALREIKWEGTRGTIWFSKDKSPAWMHQQWPDVPIFVIQYTKEGQEVHQGAILWPRRLANTDKLLFRP
jgi:branched-chain amino acid transport system substrate-binding protein